MSELSIGHADKKWIFQGIGLTIVVILLAIIFSFINPKFATTTNLLNILTQASYYIILAVGMTFVIAAAGIDLSVGSLLALITVVNFELIKGGLNPAGGVILMFLMDAKGKFSTVSASGSSTTACSVDRAFGPQSPTHT